MSNNDALIIFMVPIIPAVMVFIYAYLTGQNNGDNVSIKNIFGVDINILFAGPTATYVGLVLIFLFVSTYIPTNKKINFELEVSGSEAAINNLSDGKYRNIMISLLDENSNKVASFSDFSQKDARRYVSTALIENSLFEKNFGLRMTPEFGGKFERNDVSVRDNMLERYYFPSGDAFSECVEFGKMGWLSVMQFIKINAVKSGQKAELRQIIILLNRTDQNQYLVDFPPHLISGKFEDRLFLLRQVESSKLRSVSHDITDPNFTAGSDAQIQQIVEKFLSEVEKTGAFIGDLSISGSDEPTIRHREAPLPVQYVGGQLRVRPPGGIKPNEAIVLNFVGKYIYTPSTITEEMKRYVGQTILSNSCVAFNLITLGDQQLKFDPNGVQIDLNRPGGHIDRSYSLRALNNFVLLRNDGLKENDLVRLNVKLMPQAEQGRAN